MSGKMKKKVRRAKRLIKTYQLISKNMSRIAGTCALVHKTVLQK